MRPQIRPVDDIDDDRMLCSGCAMVWAVPDDMQDMEQDQSLALLQASHYLTEHHSPMYAAAILLMFEASYVDPTPLGNRVTSTISYILDKIAPLVELADNEFEAAWQRDVARRS